MPSIDFVPTVRYAGAVTIFFRDKHTVIVKQGSTMVIFHRWWERQDFDYSSSWKIGRASGRDRVLRLV